MTEKFVMYENNDEKWLVLPYFFDMKNCYSEDKFHDTFSNF